MRGVIGRAVPLPRPRFSVSVAVKRDDYVAAADNVNARHGGLGSPSSSVATALVILTTQSKRLCLIDEPSEGGIGGGEDRVWEREGRWGRGRWP